MVRRRCNELVIPILILIAVSGIFLNYFWVEVITNSGTTSIKQRQDETQEWLRNSSEDRKPRAETPSIPSEPSSASLTTVKLINVERLKTRIKSESVDTGILQLTRTTKTAWSSLESTQSTTVMRTLNSNILSTRQLTANDTKQSTEHPTAARSLTSEEQNLLKLAESKYIINCSNIDELKIGDRLGKGNFKITYKGKFKGKDVAIKVPTMVFGEDLDQCIEKIFNPVRENDNVTEVRKTLYTRCKEWKMSTFLHEIVNHALLPFQGIARHLGYCLPTGNRSEEILSRGIVSVFEYGTTFSISRLSAMPYFERLKHCHDIATLLTDFQFSVIGSVAYTDFYERHFKIFNNTVKIIDLDDWATPIEPHCGPVEDIPDEIYAERRVKNKYNFTCGFGLPCVKGVCIGYNAVENVHLFTDLFFRNLLNRTSIPPGIYHRHKEFLKSMYKYKLLPTDLKTGFERMILDQNFNRR